jgi:hypothetical protein
MHKKEKYISILFLAFFIFIKTAGLHTVFHSNDDLNTNECEICEFFDTSNNSPYLASEEISLASTVQHNYNNKVFYKYTFQFAPNQIDTSLFSRPPPLV